MYNLSVIIPYYKEPKKIIKRTLDSIAVQSGISHANQFEVILVNDCGTPITDESFFQDYDFEIVQLVLKKNAGPGVARQMGIDVARGQYVTFIDADDIYMNAVTFNLIYQIISQPLQQPNQVRPNLIYCKWIEEHKIEDRWFIMERNPDDTWVFQKIYRLGFLKENDIRMNPLLRWHEDSYFNAIFKAHDNIQPAQIQIPTYLWKNSNNTITRSNQGEYSLSSIHIFMDAIELATKRINNPQAYPQQITDILLYNMYSIMHPHWHDDRGKPWFEFVLKKLANLYKQYKEEIDKIDPVTFNRIVTSARARTLQEHERELWTVDEFMNVLATYDERARAKAYNHEELFNRPEFIKAKERSDKEGYNTPEVVDLYTTSYGDVLYRHDELFDYKIVNKIPFEPIEKEKQPDLPGKLEYRTWKDDPRKDKVLIGSKILGSYANPLDLTTNVEELPALEKIDEEFKSEDKEENKEDTNESISESNESIKSNEYVVENKAFDNEVSPIEPPALESSCSVDDSEVSNELKPSEEIVYSPSKSSTYSTSITSFNDLNIVRLVNVENSPLIGLSDDTILESYDFKLTKFKLESGEEVDVTDNPIDIEVDKKSEHTIEANDKSYNFDMDVSKEGNMTFKLDPRIKEMIMEVFEKVN